jgi:hypothetical protein
MADDTLQRVVDFNVLRVGMSANQPPMTMTNSEGGLMGFDVDLAKDSVLAKITSLAEFNRKELKLLALSNSTSAAFVKSAAPDAQLIEVASYDGAWPN